MGKIIIGALSTALTIAASLYLLKYSGEYIPSENKDTVLALYGVAIAAIALVLFLFVHLIRGKDEPNTEEVK